MYARSTSGEALSLIMRSRFPVDCPGLRGTAALDKVELPGLAGRDRGIFKFELFGAAFTKR